MPDKKINEKLIYSRLKEKDKAAFTLAYDTYLDQIFRFVFFKVSDQEEAEDLTSTVFLRAWDYIQDNEIKNYKTLKSFLYKVARNIVIDHYRKKSREQGMSLDSNPGIDIADDKQDMFKQLEIESDYSLVIARIYELKDEYREVIILKYINQLSVSEIAEILDKTKGNVRVLSYRAIKALREITE